MPTSWLVAYDIADPKRLRRVERAISALGERLHFSLFLCDLTDAELHRLQRRLARLIDPLADTVHYLPWCPADRAAAVHLAASAEPARAAAWVV